MARGKRLGRVKKDPKEDSVRGEQARVKKQAEDAYRLMVDDTEVRIQLSKNPTPENHQCVVERVGQIWTTETGMPPHDNLVSNFMSWANRADTRDLLPSEFREILVRRRGARVRFGAKKRRLIKLSNLSRSCVDKAAFLNEIPVRTCKQLSVAFPPPEFCISENQDILERNVPFIFGRRLPDSRLSRKRIFQLDKPETWQLPLGDHSLVHDLLPEESAQFVDGGELVAVVIRNACKDRRIVGFMDHSIEETVSRRRNARTEDPGHISQMSLPAGSSLQPKLGRVQNVGRQTSDTAVHQMIDYDASSSFTILWSLARALLPDTILDDFDNSNQTLDPGMRVDGDGSMNVSSSGRGSYRIKVGDQEFEFHNAELAPPCRVMTEDYAREIHCGNQLHTWGISFTTSRSFGPTIPSLEAGGHFYIPSYGIRVQAAPNTLIAWRLHEWHGTSLFRKSPDVSGPDSEYHQRSLCIAMGNCALNAASRWQAEEDQEAGALNGGTAEGEGGHVSEANLGPSALGELVESPHKRKEDGSQIDLGTGSERSSKRPKLDY